MSGGFLSRWSRRKLAAVAQAELDPLLGGESPEPPRSKDAGPLPASPAAPDPADAAASPGVGAEASLPPVESLSLSSDFSAFLKEEVSEALRRKALQKLFADPHFNRMDGLDIYIDDYSRPDPISSEAMAKLRHAREWLMANEPAEPAVEAGHAGNGMGPTTSPAAEPEAEADGPAPAADAGQEREPAGEQADDDAAESSPSTPGRGSGQNAP